ncbi:MAG TPA: S49 family peptidase, partial [Gemmatales bacterium]|nr:S49 family peptidase [Gemmatales bacterium]
MTKTKISSGEPVMMQRLLLTLSLLVWLATPGMGQSDKKGKDSGPCIAQIKLKGTLSDGPSGMPNPLMGTSGDTLRSIQDRIRKAAKDDDVKALYLYLEGFSAGWTEQQELRQTLAEFRLSGKKSYCYLEAASMGGYLIATACDEIAIPPVGGVEITGVRFSMYFFKDIMDKLGLKG